MYKRQMFKRGMYECKPPKEDTSKWPLSKWIEWIDSNGKWLI